MSRRWWVLVTPVAPVLAGALLAGCSSGTPGDITVAGERVLQPAVQHVREVASTHNYAELRAAVAQLKSLVRQEQAKGDVSASRAVAIEDAADKLVEDASPSPSPSPSPTTTSPTPTPTTTSPTPTPTPTPTVTTTTDVSSPPAPGGGNGDGGGIIPSG
jgi:outer membrane murein-binding lipoprotein Lpp